MEHDWVILIAGIVCGNLIGISINIFIDHYWIVISITLKWWRQCITLWNTNICRYQERPGSSQKIPKLGLSGVSNPMFFRICTECPHLSKDSSRVPRFFRICLCEEVTVIVIILTLKFKYQYQKYIQYSFCPQHYDIMIPCWGFGCREVTYIDWPWLIFISDVQL